VIVSLPESPQAIADAAWSDIEPLYEALATAPIDDAQSWLLEWSKLEEIIEEAGTLAMIAYTCDTADAAKEAANLRWSSEIFPKAIEMQVRLARRLVELGYSEPGLETVLRGFKSSVGSCWWPQRSHSSL
jgi:oligoendopeptidase F